MPDPGPDAPPKERKPNRTKKKPLSEATKRRRAARKATLAPKFTLPRGPGRPVLYDGPAHCPRAHKLALLGLTDNEIADQFGVTVDALNLWKNKYPEFLKSLNDGKMFADANVAQSHYQRAVGYNQPAVKIFMPAGATEPVYADYLEHYPGDVGAQKSWLHNRQPDRWRERKQVDVAGTLEFRISQMTPEERRARLLELQAKAAQVIEGEATEITEE